MFPTRNGRAGKEFLVREKVSRCITSFSGLLSMGRVVAAAGYCCGYRYCSLYSVSPFFKSSLDFGLLSHTALRAPPWAFTVHRGCSHYPHNVSAHALSSPRGIGILAPAPRCEACDQRAGASRVTHASPPPPHTSHPRGYQRSTAPKPAVVLLTSTSTQYFPH